MRRYRFTYQKSEALRYVGNLDLHKIWERAFRRAKLPLAYSQGFHPQPRLVQASPLPLGLTGKAELIDAWITEPLQAGNLMQKLAPVLPPGIAIHKVTAVDLSQPALPTQVHAARYGVTLLDPLPAEELQARLDELLQADSLPRRRRNKSYDLRPLIEDARLDDSAGEPGLILQLAARQGATGRADEVLDALGIPLHAARIERLQLLLG